MKFSAALLFAATAVASPTKPLAGRGLSRRQAAEACSVGYCLENGGTTGGAAGPTVTVSDLAGLTEAAESDGPLTIILNGNISGSARIRVAADKTIFGENGASLTGVGFYVRRVNNVIIRNFKIGQVDADNGDAIGIDNSQNVWIDHMELVGDLNVDKDQYDGLLDITHAADWVTVSNVHMHDHWKGSLIGHSDSNADEDTGTLHVTYANVHWENINSRVPSVRFGTVHLVNNFWDNNIGSGVNTRMGAQVLVQSSAFANSNDKAIFFADSKTTGFAIADDVSFGGSSNSAPQGSLTVESLPYSISPLGSGSVAGSVPASAGAIL